MKRIFIDSPEGPPAVSFFDNADELAAEVDTLVEVAFLDAMEALNANRLPT